MAIPDNYIDKITKDGESRMISPAADKVRVDSEHYEGDNLDDVLDEIAEAIDEAGSGDGTVKGVKVGSTTYDPDSETGVVDLSTPIAGKVDKVPGKGLSTNDYTDAEKTKLQNLPTADGLTQQLNSKANASEVAATYATKSELTSGLNGKQNTLTFDDAPGNTDNPVKSRGIKQAIELVTPTIDANGKWVIGGVSTNHDARGPKGNSVVDGDTFDIVNNLTDGGEGDALSAQQGTELLNLILQIYSNLGNYAFPNGKPTLNFNTQVSFRVTYSESDEHVTYADGQGNTAPSTVELLGRLEIQLGTDDDLYVIKESAVRVFVGGTEVSNAYNPTTDKIIIPEVYGNVVIIAQAMTYVQNGLVLHLDCRHRGGAGAEVSGHWKSLVNYGQSPIDFTLGSAVVAADTGMVFDGSANSYAETDTALNVPATDGTIEAVATIVDSESNNHFNPVLINPIENAIGLSIHNASGDSGHKNAVIVMGRGSSDYSGQSARWSGRVGDETTDFAIAVTAGTPTGVGHNKGESLTLSSYFHLIIDTTYNNKLMIGRLNRSGGDRFIVGTIRSIRVYSGHLSADQQRINWLIDKKRFNL